MSVTDEQVEDSIAAEMGDETDPVTPDEGDEGDEDGADDEDGAQVSEPVQTPAEAAAAEGSDEIAKKLKQATQGYHTRISNLLGQDMEGMICPTCDGFGFAQPDQVAQLDGPPLVHPDNYFECEGCNGYGVVVSGSRAENYVTPLCTECQGKGYTIGPVAPPVQIAPQPAAEPAPEAPKMGEYDPRYGFKPFGSDTWIPLAGGSSA